MSIVIFYFIFHQKVTFQAEITRHLQEVEKVKETQGEELPSGKMFSVMFN